MSPMKAAFKGSKEIGFAIIAMTLTLAAVYVPFAFSTGRTGKLFIEFALTLAGAVLVSGFTALTLSPMMCSRLLRHESEAWPFLRSSASACCTRWTSGYKRRAAAGAGRMRWWSSARPRWSLAGVFVLFTLLPNELAPPEDQGLVIGFASAPEGSTIDYTDNYAKQMEEAFKKIPEMDRYFEIVGFDSVTSAIGFVRPEGLVRTRAHRAAGRRGPVSAVHGHHRRDGIPDHAAAARPGRLRPAGQLRGADHRHLGRSRRSWCRSCWPRCRRTRS